MKNSKSNKIFDRQKWVISNDKKVRYENMRYNLKEMNVLKAFEYKNKDKE